jgi:glutathione peroxidase
MSVYDYTVQGRNGEEVSLSTYKGKVLLIVNTATRCGFTPEYTELEKLYEAYREKGFEILDFPCNQFNGQAPESIEEIHEICKLKFGTQFPQFGKVRCQRRRCNPVVQVPEEQEGIRGLRYEPQDRTHS